MHVRIYVQTHSNDYCQSSVCSAVDAGKSLKIQLVEVTYVSQTKLKNKAMIIHSFQRMIEL